MGYRNRFNHPRPEVTARYESIRAAVSRSDRDGALLLHAGGDELTPSLGGKRRGATGKIDGESL